MRMFPPLIFTAVMLIVSISYTEEVQVPSLEEFGQVLGQISEQILPSMVTIITRTVISEETTEIPASILLNRSIDPFGADWTYRNPDAEHLVLVQEEQASGVIISTDGYVVTSRHAVAGAYEIVVYLSNGDVYSADMIGCDAGTDLALIRIFGNDFTAIPLGDSRELRVGEFILSFGSPFLLTQTVSLGIVSYLGRSDLGFVDYENYIQTDVLLNPGSSGGALVNLRGELVGINSAIATASGSYQGIGFAVPVSSVAVIIEEIMDRGGVVRGYIGMMVRPLTPSQIAEQEDLENGVFVAVVLPGSAAEETGIRRGDIIVSLDGLEVESTYGFSFQIASHHPGDTVELVLLRGDTLLSETVQFQQRPENLSPSAITPFTGLDPGWAISELESGAVQIDRVALTGPAVDAGLLSGDIILCINHSVISGIEDLYMSMVNSGREALLTISRSGRTVYYSLKY
jgi:serine protease Do